jgi:hypothetical protein
MSILRKAMGQADRVEDKVVHLGRATLENKVSNVKSAQARLVKACEEVSAARSYLASAQADLAGEINGLDCGIKATVETVHDELITEATR